MWKEQQLHYSKYYYSKGQPLTVAEMHLENNQISWWLGYHLRSFLTNIEIKHEATRKLTEYENIVI